MELRHIPLEELKLTKVNVRHGRKAPDVSDILPSIRKRGILQPLLVRPNGDGFEIVAGRRRYFAAMKVQKEAGEFGPVPCAVMDTQDDAEAVEASLLENLARLPMDLMDQYEAFAKLAREGREIAEIAETFGVTDLTVKRVLALANLIPAIKTAYRNDEIDQSTLRVLTMASKAQQAEWLKLHRGEDSYAPRGEQLKRWLFGGHNIRTSVALFDVSDYDGAIAADLFGGDSYFADADQFWKLQGEAVEARKQALLDAGWTSVDVLERGAYFCEWDHEKTQKKKGGRVYVSIRHDGEVAFHEGYIPLREARAKAARGGDGVEACAKPEITKAMQTYLELHRHALVRTELLNHPAVALRLTIAHMIAGSALWNVQPEPQKAPKPEIAASVRNSASQSEFDNERAEVLKLLDLEPDRAELVRHNGDAYPAAMMFAKLLEMEDADVMRIMTFAMAETLQSGSCLVEAVGVHLAVGAEGKWHADDIFFELLRDKATINAVLKDIAGKDVAEANSQATGKVQKGIVVDCLRGENGRKRIEDWVPDWLKFPFTGHTKAPIETTAIGADWRRIAEVFKPEPDRS
ncbi:ParB/RepB/Spo0J family partition protein [Nitratireductor sp. XY-223]|uniref:ParB/RepB/Spo0J family partition protein n=1 Tax=Nitratireductor sp. XY-223 TaxID=2561926 RepID=UPI0010AA4276|nr:ParB/RepB/Spo0J family partition protein [Nitratireductor sp. XY-223]